MKIDKDELDYGNHLAIHAAMEMLPELKAAGMGVYEYIVLLCLAKRASHGKHRCYPSLLTIADESCGCRNTVIKAIRALIKANFMRTIGSDPIYGNTVYELTFDQLPRIERKNRKKVFDADAMVVNEVEIDSMQVDEVDGGEGETYHHVTSDMSPHRIPDVTTCTTSCHHVIGGISPHDADLSLDAP